MSILIKSRARAYHRKLFQTCIQSYDISRDCGLGAACRFCFSCCCEVLPTIGKPIRTQLYLSDARIQMQVRRA